MLKVVSLKVRELPYVLCAGVVNGVYALHKSANGLYNSIADYKKVSLEKDILGNSKYRARHRRHISLKLAVFISVSLGLCVLTVSAYIYSIMYNDCPSEEDKDNLINLLGESYGAAGDCVARITSATEHIGMRYMNIDQYGICMHPKMILGKEVPVGKISGTFFINPDKVRILFSHLFSNTRFDNFKKLFDIDGDAIVSNICCTNANQGVRMSVWKFINSFLESVEDPNGVKCSASSFIRTVNALISGYDCFGSTGKCKSVVRYKCSDETPLDETPLDKMSYTCGDCPDQPLSVLADLLLENCARGTYLGSVCNGRF